MKKQLVVLIKYSELSPIACKRFLRPCCCCLIVACQTTNDLHAQGKDWSERIVDVGGFSQLRFVMVDDGQ